MAEQRIGGVILAGGINTIPLYEGYRPGNKALIEFAGRCSLAFVLDAFAGCAGLDDLIVVGPEDELSPAVTAHCGAVAARVHYAIPKDSLLENFLTGLEAARGCERVLVASSDLPMLTADVLQSFVATALQIPSQYPHCVRLAVVRKEDFTGPYARVDKALSHFRDQIVCHGNVLLADRAMLNSTPTMTRINAVYEARKSALRSALALGLNVGLAYVVGVHFLHLLTMDRMAAIASRRFQLGILPVPVPYPQVAIDVDEPADYALVKELIEG